MHIINSHLIEWVGILQDRVLVGSEAKRQLYKNPESTYTSVKRLIGIPFEAVSAELQYASYAAQPALDGSTMLWCPARCAHHECSPVKAPHLSHGECGMLNAAQGASAHHAHEGYAGRLATHRRRSPPTLCGTLSAMHRLHFAMSSLLGGVLKPLSG